MRQSEYGVSLGPWQKTKFDPYTLKKLTGGIRLDIPADALAEDESPNVVDIRLDQGGLSTDFATTVLAGPAADGEPHNVMSVAPFNKKSGTKYLMRLRPTRWDRWNGANWLTLPGTLTGTVLNRYYTTIANDLFIAANGVNRLQKWDGVDANAVADLSADAPVARYVVRIGNRLLAAAINSGGFNPDFIAWSADGLITDWTTAGAGAGLGELLPEGPSKSENVITGLSAISQGAVIYRQRSIVLGSLTGVGAAPFRFNSVKFSQGTESPYSISSGGPVEGDYFLGYDFMVYFFDGENCTPIGPPVIDLLRDSIYDLATVTGVVDPVRMEYWLCYPIDSSLLLKAALTFSIRAFVTERKLVWRRRSVPPTLQSLGAAVVGVINDPIVDTVFDIVNTVIRTPDSFAAVLGADRMVFGDSLGQVTHIDFQLGLTTGTWESREFGDASNEVTIDRIRVKYNADSPSTIEVSASIDGGTTWANPAFLNLDVTGTAPEFALGELRITGRIFQLRVRILSGFCNISEINCVILDRGVSLG